MKMEPVQPVTINSIEELIRYLLLSKVGTVDARLLDWQARAAEKIHELFTVEPGGFIAVLRAPSGAGKTEAYLAPFLYSYIQEDPVSPRMYVIEPMHSIISGRSGVAYRARSYVKALRSGQLPGAQRLSVGVDHGDVSPTYLYTAAITVTTVDSFAYGYLAQRVQRWRSRYGVLQGRFTMPAGLLAGSYIVFDEAHLIQDEVFLSYRVIGNILCTLAEAGAGVVLSTATLPSRVKEILTCSRESRVPVKELPTPGKLKPRNIDIQVHLNEKIVSNEHESSPDVNPDIVEGLTREDNLPALILMNTVKRAVNVYQALRRKLEGYRVVLLHSLMTMGDREKKQRLIEAEVENGGKLVVVATQVLEAGVDLSFRALYTEAAPPDALLQRLGRAGRRGEEAVAHIYRPENDKPYASLGGGRVDKALGMASKLDAGILADVGRATKLLDEFYDDGLVDELIAKGDRLYANYLYYLSHLNLFSYPPDDIDASIRPTSYLTVVIAADTEETGKGRLQLKGRPLIRLSVPATPERANWSRCKALVEKCSGKARLYPLQSIRIIEKGEEPAGDTLEPMCNDSQVVPLDYVIEARYSEKGLGKNSRCPDRGIVIVPREGEGLESCYMSETGLNIYDRET